MPWRYGFRCSGFGSVSETYRYNNDYLAEIFNIHIFPRQPSKGAPLQGVSSSAVDGDVDSQA
jgi:hypothetical protein